MTDYDNIEKYLEQLNETFFHIKKSFSGTNEIHLETLENLVSPGSVFDKDPLIMARNVGAAEVIKLIKEIIKNPEVMLNDYKQTRGRETESAVLKNIGL